MSMGIDIVDAPVLIPEGVGNSVPVDWRKVFARFAVRVQLDDDGFTARLVGDAQADALGR